MRHKTAAFCCDKHQQAISFQSDGRQRVLLLAILLLVIEHSSFATLAFYSASNAENVVVVIRGKHHGNQEGLLFLSLCKQQEEENSLRAHLVRTSTSFCRSSSLVVVLLVAQMTRCRALVVLTLDCT